MSNGIGSVRRGRALAAALAGAAGLVAAASCNEIAGIEDGILLITDSGGSAGAAGAAGAAGTGAAGAAGAAAGTGGTMVTECQPDETQRCYDGKPENAGKGICVFGMEACDSGKWGPCMGGDTMPTMETCDGMDSDCDGIQDNGCACMAGSQRACRRAGRSVTFESNSIQTSSMPWP